MTRGDWSNGAVGAIVGGVFGVALVLLSLSPMGAGHGTYLTVAIFGAPLSLIGGWPLFSEVVLMWMAIGFLLAARNPVPATVILSLHLVGVLVVLQWGSGLETGEEQWQYLERARPHFARAIRIAFLTYAAGHLLAWIVLALRWVKRKHR